MPQLQKPESDRLQKIRAIRLEDIEDTYRKGYITAQDRNNLVREKARATVGQVLEDEGYFGAILKQTIQHLNDGWENLKESSIREPTGDVRTELYYVGLAMWGQIQMLTSAFNAFGEVTGQVAENMSLRAGASPGLARAINIAVDIGTGVLPVGAAVKSGVKGIQALGKTQQAKAALKAEQLAGKQALSAILEGLEIDGVKGARKVMGEAAEAAGKEAPDLRVVKEGIESVASKASASIKDTFLSDLRKFRREMEKITATQAHEETAKLADRLGLSLDDLRNVIPGQALDEKQMLAYLKALEPQVDTLIDLARKTVQEGTEEAANALAQHASEFFTLAPVFRSAEVTAGRSVEILKETPPMKKLTDMLMGWDAESLAKGDFQGAMKTFAEDIVSLADQPDKIQAMAVINQGLWHRFKEGGWPMMREAYMNLLLARPLTQVKNFLGNSVAATNTILEHMAGSAFSIDKQAGLVGKEGVYMAKGMMMAIGDGLSAFGKAFKNITPDEASKFDFVPHKIPGVLGRIINIPGDTMRGMDNFFKEILKRGSYYSEALRDGLHKGLAGKELTDFVARRVSNPTKTMLDNGAQFALENTFQNELGKMGQIAQKGLQAGPLALWFPFMKTPMNLAKYAWNRTPGLQLLSTSLYKDIMAGGVKADMAIGRLTVSNLMGMFLFEMAKDGIITGSGPVDPALRRAWLATHQPYSIRTKDGWMPITNTEPGTTILGMVGDYAQVMNQLDDPTAEQAAMAIAFTIMNDLADKTYWRTVSDLVDVASSAKYGEEPMKKIEKTLMAPVVTVATGGPAVGAVTRAIDPIRRESRSFMDEIVSRVPGYSKTLPPMRDGYGDPILPPQAIGGAWLGIASPLTFKSETDDPLKQMGSKLQAKLPRFPWTIGGKTHDEFDLRQPMPEDRIAVELTPQQRDRAQQIYKNMIRHPEHGMETTLLNNATFQKQTRAMQREMFESFLADAKSTALDALLVEDPPLFKKVLQSEAMSLKPLMNEQDQRTLERQVGEATTLMESLAPEQRRNLMRWGILESPAE